MANGKIGIGPEGSLGGFIQLIILSFLGIVLCVYALPLDLIILKIMPATLIMLVALGHLSLLGDSFPYAPPGGDWTPEKSRFSAGLRMTCIWVVFTFAVLLFMRFVYPGWPIGPLYIWFGAIAFGLTLLYGINWNGWPFKGHMHPWAMMAVGFVVIMGLSILIWTTLTNLDGTPLADTPMNHHGPLQAEWFTGYIVWVIAWFFVFNPVFTTQGWPFGKLGHPGAAVAQTIIALILGYIFWNGSLSMGISPSLSFGAIASSIILWGLIYGWHLQFWGITKQTFGTRAVLAFIIQCIIVVVWIFILRLILAPAAAALAAAQLPADINILILYFNLCILGPALIGHNAFWLRWPLTMPAPPGTPPPDQSV
ncbi:MAG: hypothetical protein ACOWYE_09280 [Desulfatiglandales bacterium]